MRPQLDATGERVIGSPVDPTLPARYSGIAPAVGQVPIRRLRKGSPSTRSDGCLLRASSCPGSIIDSLPRRAISFRGRPHSLAAQDVTLSR